MCFSPLFIPHHPTSFLLLTYFLIYHLMTQETGVESLVESYQRLKKSYLITPR